MLTLSEYKIAKGIGVGKKSKDPYCWDPSAVVAILDNQAYTGITESLEITSLTFTNKKRVPLPKERRAVIEDSHEPILDSLVWEKVKGLR